jgi:hypothetical protein
MKVPNNFEEMVRTHMQATSIAYETGFEQGWQAAITEVLRIVKPLSESSRELIAASRIPTLTRKQA